MMQAIDNESVATEVALEPLGYASNGGRAEARPLLDLRVGDTVAEKLRCLKAPGKLFDLFDGQQIAQKALRFGVIFERQYGINQILIFLTFPIHSATLGY